MSAHRSRRGARSRNRGAALVEFALVAPLLFMLLFGVIEFGFGFLQFLDVRHGAREAGRLAAVNYRPDLAASGTDQAEDIIDETCLRLDGVEGVTITLTRTGTGAIGETVEVSVSRTYTSLTGFFDSFTPTLTSRVTVRLEQAATWSTHTGACPP